MTRSILVTGATDGIGRALALHLAQQGAQVVVHGRNQKKLESVYDEIRISSSQGTKGYISSPGPPMDFTVNLHYAGGGGAYTFSAPPTGDLNFWVGNDLEEVTTPFGTNSGGDKLTVSGGATTGLDDVPWDRQSMTLWLRDSTATVFSDDLIPESLDIADFDDNFFMVTFTNAEGLAYKHLQLFVDDLFLVSSPEPSTCLLAALSGIGLLFRRGYRHSARRNR